MEDRVLRLQALLQRPENSTCADCQVGANTALAQEARKLSPHAFSIPFAWTPCFPGHLWFIASVVGLHQPGRLPLHEMRWDTQRPRRSHLKSEKLFCIYS